MYCISIPKCVEKIAQKCSFVENFFSIFILRQFLRNSHLFKPVTDNVVSLSKLLLPFVGLVLDTTGRQEGQSTSHKGRKTTALDRS